jgi:hypothetical protein
MPQLGPRLVFVIAIAVAMLRPPMAQAGAPLQVVIPALHPSSTEHAAYFPALLRLALDKTVARDGPYALRHFDQQLTSPRQAIELKTQGVINVMWDGTDARRESELLAIKISLLRQLNDSRVLLIRSDDRKNSAPSARSTACAPCRRAPA